MEDTHAWVINADGTNRREIGARIDNRQGPPRVDAGRPRAAVHGAGARQHAAVSRADHVRRAARAACPAKRSSSERGSGRRVLGGEGHARVHVRDARRDQAELYVRAGSAAARRLTDLNARRARRQGARAGRVVHLRLERQQVRGRGVSHEADRPAADAAGRRRAGQPTYPLIVNIHGGPHGQQGPAFNFKNQVYAARGWATLMVNYRGSTGYGQAFTDAVFADQNGNEGQDVLYGVERRAAALSVDRSRPARRRRHELRRSADRRG